MRIPKHLGWMLITFHQDLGAENLLPSGTNDRVSYINRLHRMMLVQNDMCPPEVDFGVIYSRFTSAVLTGKAEPKGYSIKPLCDAFNRWVTSQDVRESLYQAHYILYPDDRPRQIAQTSDQRRASPGLDTSKYVEQSPEDIAGQIRILDTIYGGLANGIRAAEGGDSYFQRLKNTYELYKEQGRL